MPKQKTNRSAAKRFRVTGGGKIRYKKQGLRHLLSKKNRKLKQDVRKGGILSPAENSRVKAMLRK